MNWKSIIKAIAPKIIHAINPTLDPLVGVITEGIVTAQEIHGARKGPEKRAHVIAAAAHAAKAINAAKGQELLDPVLVATATGSVVSAIVDTANVVHDAQASAHDTHDDS